ncbi:MAG: CPBP family glutamic-type intramembrane protease [bacterium]
MSLSGNTSVPLRQVIALLYVCLLLTMVVGSIIQFFWNLGYGLMISEVGFVLLPTLLLVYMGRFDARGVLRIKGVGIIEVLLGVAIIVFLQPLVLGLQALIQFLFPLPDYVARAMRSVTQFSTVGEAVKVVVAVSILPGICEEALFRGVVQRTFEGKWGMWRGLIITSMIFGAFHLDPWRLLPLMIIAVFIGYAVMLTDSIFVGIAMHATNNLLAIIFSHLLSAGSMEEKIGALARVMSIAAASISPFVLIFGIRWFWTHKRVDVNFGEGKGVYGSDARDDSYSY